MKNHNISEYKGNFETAFKNGDFRQILIIGNLSSEFNKIINNISDKKEVSASEKIPFSYTLLKIRSPFRIGIQQIRVFKFEEIASRDRFDAEKFTNVIKSFSKHYKNTITAIPINGVLSYHSNTIEKILAENVIGTKFVIVR